MYNKFKCTVCGKKFRNPISLDRHIRVVHHKSIYTIHSPHNYNKVISLKIDEHTYIELKELAEIQGTSVSQLIRSLIYVGISLHRRGRKRQKLGI